MKILGKRSLSSGIRNGLIILINYSYINNNISRHMDYFRMGNVDGKYTK